MREVGKNSHFREIGKYFQLTSKSRTLTNAKLYLEVFFFPQSLNPLSL